MTVFVSLGFPYSRLLFPVTVEMKSPTDWYDDISFLCLTHEF